MYYIRDIYHTLFRRPYALASTMSGNKKVSVVLLHGIASDSNVWSPLLSILPSNIGVLCIDLLGFGRSPKPQSSRYTLQNHAASVIKTLKKHHVTKPVIIIGHSLGGLIAIEIAHQAPRMVSQLIVCNPPLYNKKEIASTLAHNDSSGRIHTNVLFQLYELVTRKRDTTLQAANRIVSVAPKSNTFILTPETWIPFQRSLQYSIMQQNSLRTLQSITTPTTIIYGSLDVLVIAKHFESLASKYQHIRTQTFQGSHMINKQAAKKILYTLKV